MYGFFPQNTNFSLLSLWEAHRVLHIHSMYSEFGKMILWEHPILLNSNVNCHNGLDHVFSTLSSTSWLLWTEMKKGILRKTLGQIWGENKMKPYAAALLPSQVEMLLKHSLNKNHESWWWRNIFLKGHLTRESFVASVAAVSLLLTRSRQQPKSYFEGASKFQ